MITRSASKSFTERTTTKDKKNLHTPNKSQRSLPSKSFASCSKTMESTMSNKTNELKRGRTSLLSTPRKRQRQELPETSSEKLITTPETNTQLHQTSVFNINIHVPPINVNSPFPGLPPIHPIICLNFDDLSKCLTKNEASSSSPANNEVNVEKFKDLFSVVTPKCNIVYENHINSFSPGHKTPNTNAFQCGVKNNNLIPDENNLNFNLSLSSNCNSNLGSTMENSVISPKQACTLRDSKSSKKEKTKFSKIDKDFVSVAPQINKILNSLLKKKIESNQFTSDINKLKISANQKSKCSNIDENVADSESDYFKKFNLKHSVVVLEDIYGKERSKVNEKFASKIHKTGSLNNSKNNEKNYFEEDSLNSANLKLVKKADTNKNGCEKEENNLSNRSQITSSKYEKKDFNVNTKHYLNSNLEGKRNPKCEVLGKRKSVAGSDSRDNESFENTKCFNNSSKKAKVNSNSGKNEQVVDNKNISDFPSTEESFNSSQKKEVKCKKSLQFDNSDLLALNKRNGKVYSVVYESDVEDSQKEKIFSITEGCNFSELIKKIQTNEIREKILSLVKNYSNSNSNISEFCDSSKKHEAGENKNTLKGSKNVSTDIQNKGKKFIKYQNNKKNVNSNSEKSESDVEEHINFHEGSDEIEYFSDEFNWNSDDFESELKEKTEKRKSNNSGEFQNKDSTINSFSLESESESISSVSTVLFDIPVGNYDRNKNNKKDEETLNENENICSDHLRKVIEKVDSERKNKKIDESENDDLNKKKSVSENSDVSENDDNDVNIKNNSHIQTEKIEKIYKNKKTGIGKIGGSNNCKETEKGRYKFKDCNVSEDENIGGKNTILEEANNSKKYGKKIKQGTKEKGEIENVRKRTSSVSDSCGSDKEEGEEKNCMVLKNAKNNSNRDEKIDKTDKEEVKKTEYMSKNTSSETDSSDSDVGGNERKMIKSLKETRNSNRQKEPITEDREKMNGTENIRKNISRNSDNSDSNEDKDEGKIVKTLAEVNTSNKCNKPIAEYGAKKNGTQNIRKNISSDGDSSDGCEDDDRGKINKVLEKANNRNKYNQSIAENVEKKNGTENKKNISSDSDSSESSEDEGKIIKTLKEVNTSNKCNKPIAEYGEKKNGTQNIKKNISSDSDSTDSSEDDDKGKINKVLEKANNRNKYNQSIAENVEKKNGTENKKNISSDIDNSDSSEDEDEGKIIKTLKEVNTSNKCNKPIAEYGEKKNGTQNIKKNISSDSDSTDSSEDEDDRKMRKILKNISNISKCKEPITEDKEEEFVTESVRENVSSDSDSSDNSDDDIDRRIHLICVNTNNNFELINQVIKADKEELKSKILRKNISSDSESSDDESEDETKKKTNGSSFKDKIEEQKRKGSKNLSENSDVSGTEDETEEQNCGDFEEGRGSFYINTEDEDTEIECVSDKSEDENKEKRGRSFKKVNVSGSNNSTVGKEETNLENGKINIFKNVFSNKYEEENNKSSINLNGNKIDKISKEKMECKSDGKYNSKNGVSSESEDECSIDENMKGRKIINSNCSQYTDKEEKSEIENFEKANSKKKTEREDEENGGNKNDNDDYNGENCLFRGNASDSESGIDTQKGGQYSDDICDPDGNKRKKIKKTNDIEVDSLKTEIRVLSNENEKNSKFVEKLTLDAFNEGNLKKKVKSSSKGGKKLKKLSQKREQKIMEKSNHQASSPPKKMGKNKNKPQSSRIVKSKKKEFSEDYIPLKAIGSTRFGVSNLNKLQPYQKHSALNFKKEMFFGDSVKRFKSNAEYKSYKHKQDARNFK